MGKNIKQLTKRTSLSLSDLFYIVSSDIDYNTDFDSVKTLFGIDSGTWQTGALTYNATNYIDTQVDTTTYGVAKIEYMAIRGSRTYRSGVFTIMYDSTQIVYSDFWDVTSSDNDDLGLTLTARLNGNNMQMKLVVDNSDANNITFNWKIVTKKPISV